MSFTCSSCHKNNTGRDIVDVHLAYSYGLCEDCLCTAYCADCKCPTIRMYISADAPMTDEQLRAYEALFNEGQSPS